MRQAVIVAATRSPIGRARKGSLASIRADDLAAQMISAALSQVPELDPGQIDDLLLGCGLPAGEQGFNLARTVAVQLGHNELPGTTVTRFCSSSLQTTRMALHAIRAEEGTAFISAGVESVSRYGEHNDADTSPHTQNPVFSAAQHRAARVTAGELPWSDPHDEGLLPDPYIGMGQTAENVAQITGISRQEQDQWGVRSHNLAEAASARGHFAREITPVTLADGTVVRHDDGIRPGTTMDSVSSLKPLFREGGTVTAGNTCPLNDGAAALVIMEQERAQAMGITPLARIVSTGVSALSPEIMGLGPVEATRRALQLAGMTINDVDLVEINEAFAVQVIGSARELDIAEDRLNVSGGAIALGHPFGMSGARITASLLNNLRDRDVEIGLETMCVGGGQGMAMIVERLS